MTPLQSIKLLNTLKDLQLLTVEATYSLVEQLLKRYQELTPQNISTLLIIL